MNNVFKCPACGEMAMRMEIIPVYKTRLSRVAVEIPNAQFERCDACGESTVSAKELKRWREVADKEKTNEET